MARRTTRSDLVAAGGLDALVGALRTYPSEEGLWENTAIVMNNCTSVDASVKSVTSQERPVRAARTRLRSWR